MGQRILSQMRNERVTMLWVWLVAAATVWAEPGGPYFATGIKIGEVTSSSAIVWTRLTRRPTRNPTNGPMVSFVYEPTAPEQQTRGRHRKVVGLVYPFGMSVDELRDAVPGAIGVVRVQYKPAFEHRWQSTRWRTVNPLRDYTYQFTLHHLRPDTEYVLRVEGRRSVGAAPGQVILGRFRTAPPPDVPRRVLFTVSTGQSYQDRDLGDRGFKIYDQMLKLKPDFFVHTGDIVYYDRLAKTAELARYHWQRTYSLPSNLEFHRQVASYFIKDDHDTWCNDCWPTMKTGDMGVFTFAQGQAIFREQVPMGARTYRTFRWGKDLQIWLVEGRDFRSPNPMPDGPEKTIWGAEQKAWFKQTVSASDATFRVLISPTPLVGPDRESKNDNHANKGFRNEGNELRNFIGKQRNMVVLCGDRHWQYVSVDPGTAVREYSCGPASDRHAGGWPQNRWVKEYHHYLNVIGGFLCVIVSHIDGRPTLILRHYSVDGDVLNEDRLTAE